MDLRALVHPLGPAPEVRALAEALDPFADPFPLARDLEELLSDAAAPHDVVLGSTCAELLGMLCRAFVPAGARALVAGPCPDWHTRELLAAGLVYTDLGRDQHFAVRPDALGRVLADQDVALLLLGHPALPTGVPLDRSVVRQALTTTTETLVVIDETGSGFGAEGRWPAHPRLVILRDLALVAGLHPHRLACVTATPEITRMLRLMRPDPALSAHALACVASGLEHAREVQVAALRSTALEALQGLGGVTPARSVAPSLFARVPGVEGTALQAGLAREGVLVQASADHTWRDGVALRVPLADQLERLVAAFRAVLPALLCVLALACGKAPQPASPAAAAPDAGAAPSTAPTADADPNAPPGVFKRTYQTPLVGGCRLQCRNARDALTGFVASLGSPDHVSRVPLFVDTASLKVDAVEAGARLAALWAADELAKRAAEVEQLAEGLAKGAAGLDEATLLARAEAARFVEWPERATAIVSLAGDTAWRVRLERRGTEWLVTRIERGVDPDGPLEPAR